MSGKIPRSQDISQPVRQALIWLRNYVDTSVAAAGGGGGGGSGSAVLDGGDSSTASFSSSVDGGSA